MGEDGGKRLLVVRGLLGRTPLDRCSSSVVCTIVWGSNGVNYGWYGMVPMVPVQARKALRETRDTRGACATERATSYGMEKIGSNACLVVLLHLVLSPLRVTHRYAGVIRMTGDVMSHNRVEHHIHIHTQNCPVYVSLIQKVLHYRQFLSETHTVACPDDHGGHSPSCLPSLLLFCRVEASPITTLVVVF